LAVGIPFLIMLGIAVYIRHKSNEGVEPPRPGQPNHGSHTPLNEMTVSTISKQSEEAVTDVESPTKSSPEPSTLGLSEQEKRELAGLAAALASIAENHPTTVAESIEHWFVSHGWIRAQRSAADKSLPMRMKSFNRILGYVLASAAILSGIEFLVFITSSGESNQEYAGRCLASALICGAGAAGMFYKARKEE
jgi:hypothetical protein